MGAAGAAGPAVRTVSLEALRPYWYPVARSDELGASPIAATLLGERIALYRAGGKVVAFNDLCIHRGTPLSLGWVDGEALVCAYHGWTYAPSGACVRIPSLPAGRPIPAKARVPAYPAEERHGLIWVCLEEPRSPIPDYPEAQQDGFRTIWTQYQWRASAPRVIENVMDFAHFPWVHPGVLGHREKPVYPDVKVSVDEDHIGYVVDDEATNAIRAYRVTLPLTLHMRVDRRDATVGEDRVVGMLFVARPVSERETTFYFGHARNFALEDPDEVWAERNTSVTDQDQRIVEAQRPEELPLDLSAELHLKGSDAPAVEYRRALSRLGIEG